MIDLRSDTVTCPSKKMLECMVKAEVGDDVFGEDPTVQKLEAMTADLAGMEAAIFAPSGTQANLMALLAHCQRGDEYIVGQTAHTYMWEGGGAAVLGGIQPQPLDFAPDGTLPLEKVAMAIKPIDDLHPRTKLLCLENTMNGKVLPLSYLNQARSLCKETGLASHLDGARAFNAAVKLNVPLSAISKNFDSISICLSKSLGAPVGSLLCGSKPFIKEARRWRKTLGGGMRQVGILAAAGVYALENNINRLAEDHDNAQFLAQELSTIAELEVHFASLHTNIFFVKINKAEPELRAHLFKNGVSILPPFKGIATRFITHLDVTREALHKVVSLIKGFYAAWR